MGIINWLINLLYNFSLRKRLNQKSKETATEKNNHSKHIGILFDESQLNQVESIEQYLQAWASKGKIIETFRFVDVKSFPPLDDPSNRICRKDVTWYKVPKGNKVDTFLHKKFDLLITINPEKKKFMHYLNAASNAKFKIGLLPDELEFYNLIIDCEQANQVQSIFKNIELTINNLSD